MDREQFVIFKEEMKEHLTETVKSTVNGKIDAMNVKLSDYIKLDTEWKDTWEKKNEPVIKAFENTSWLWGFFIGTLKFLGIVGVAVGGWSAVKHFLFK